MKVITIGRNDNNDVIINDPFVGRNHCQIVENDGILIIVDLNSVNGTYVNGTRIIGQHPLSLTDVVRIGQTILNWQSYFKIPDADRTVDPAPSQPTTLPPAKSNKTKIIVACVALLFAIGGVASYFIFQPDTKHASALPHNMVALMSFNLRTLQKQAGISQDDLSQLATKIEKDVYNNRVDVFNSGVKYSAPMYAFVEDIDIRSEKYSWGVVIPLSNQQQFADFLQNINLVSRDRFNTYRNIQYVSDANVFLGFDQDKCLFYSSFYLTDYQLENKCFELMEQGSSNSGKNSDLFNMLGDNPISCIVSGKEYSRLLDELRNEYRNSRGDDWITPWPWNSLGLDFTESYLSMQMEAQNNGLEFSINCIDGDAKSKNDVFSTIKGTRLNEFSLDDIAFAAINVNGRKFLQDFFASVPSTLKSDVYQLFEKYNRESIDIEGFISAVQGDVYLSIQDLTHDTYTDDYVTYSTEIPILNYMAEMPSSSELNSSIRSVQNLIEYNREFRSLFENVERDGNFISLKSSNFYQTRSHATQQQYQKDICDKFMYASINVNNTLEAMEREKGRSFQELKPYIKYVNRTSASASAANVSFKIDLLRPWQYILNNL